MSDMNYVKGDLFLAPKGSLLIHSCNCQGIWGAGIAKQFASKFPRAYRDYQDYCKTSSVEDLLGTVRIFEESGYYIASLMVSSGYGTKKDKPADIRSNTDQALRMLLRMIQHSKAEVDIHMPKINSGLFGVPWRFTESSVRTYLKIFGQLKITVYDPNLNVNNPGDLLIKQPKP